MLKENRQESDLQKSIECDIVFGILSINIEIVWLAW